MPQTVQFTAPGEVELVDVASEPLAPGTVRVRTWYSGVSAGTELTAYRGSNPYLSKTWDPARRIFTEGAPTFGYPVSGWGYSEVGEVVECADDVADLPPGTAVFGIWGHRSEAVVAAGPLRAQRVPTGAEAIHGVFARVGAIALNAVLGTETRLGEWVAIFGQGVIGLLATQLARLSGARVIAVEGIAGRRRLAEELGARATVDPDVAGGAGAAVRQLTGDVGADSAIELSGSYAALQEAIRCVVPDGRVQAAGFYQGEATALRLGEEFHHNRVHIVASQIGGTPLPLGPRWNHARLVSVFMDQVATGAVDVAPLITDVVECTDVATAFRTLDEQSARTLQVVLRFPGAPA
ncbi:zinc-dependent alcohol dehydrogenase [Georgenia subflava]|uniref:Zinc-binding dehydrogenase n=1 Tax=Georgenia subflava TaxID=1622177 RepID=A0A6N7EGL2_9MICO|nr:zinc-binding alcohol dehydrogenase [Georgenia subflava]MPV36108.1 zinc-binding dehydrogenase [Georgenia subflava]